MNAPNILMIMTDQQRGDCLGCAGHPVIETPYLDELAAQGTYFPRAYSATPSCQPARATLLTGMNHWHTGVLDSRRARGRPSRHYRHTMPGELASAGYHTQAVGKNHFLPQRALNGYHNCILDESSRVIDPGFVSDYRRWFERYKDGPYGYRDHSVGWNSWMGRPTHLPEHLHPTHWTAQQAIEWLGRRDPQKPFFLKVSFARPHSPYDPPQVYYDMYKDRRMPDPFESEWGHAWCDQQEPAAATDAHHGTHSDVETQRARACYYGSITFIDHQIGRLLYELKKEHGAAYENTLIIFTSDHGDMLGDHCKWRKGDPYEGSARVPMIVRPPTNWNWPVGQTLDQVVELQDIMPTALDAAGVAIPGTVDGRSMLPLARGDVQVAWRPHIVGEHPGTSFESTWFFLSDGKTKYIWYPYTGTEQLFDLDADPGEIHDLTKEPPASDRVTAWRQRMVDELADRDVGLVHGGTLVTLGPDQFIDYPHSHRYGCVCNDG